MPAPQYPGQPVAKADFDARKRLALVFAQFGKPRLRRQALAMLIGANDLSGPGWRELGTGSWRFGFGDRGAVASRVRKSGEFTALRRFRNDEFALGVMAQVLPFPSEADAGSQVEKYPSSSVMPWTGVTALEERIVDGIGVLHVDHLVALERLNERDDLRGYSRQIFGHIGRIAFLVTCTGSGNGCAWDDVVGIATAQADRLRELQSNVHDQM